MLVIALTGGIGCGKSMVAKYFRQQGVSTIDTDKIARQLSSRQGAAYPKICNHFGTTILEENGDINRRKLRKIIFAVEKQRLWLEELLHPLIITEATRRLEDSDNDTPYYLIEIPLLVNIKKPQWISRVLFIDAPKAVRVERVKKRDQIEPSDIQAMMQVQSNRKEWLAIADDVIENTGTMVDLEQKVEHLHNYYLQLTA